MRLLGPLLVFLIGASTAVEAGASAQLTRSFKEFWWPAAIFATTSGVLLLVCALLSGTPLPDRATLLATPWWAWTAGVLGAVYALSMVVFPDRLGSAVFTGMTVSAAILASVLLDHMGWVGFKEHPAGIGRLVGAGLMILGLGLVAAF